MDRLPTELLDIIYNYLPISTTYKLNTSAFYKNYRLLVIERLNSYIRIADVDNYMRYLVRKNCYLHLNVCLAISRVQWSKKWWKYQNKSYPNYMSYLKAMAIKYNSNRMN